MSTGPETQGKPGDNLPGSLRVIEGKKDKAAHKAAERLEELAAAARAGEVIGFHGITLLSNGRYQVHDAGGLSRLEAAGALLDAAIARLGYAVIDD